MPGAYASPNLGTVEDRVVVSNTLQGVYHVEVHNASENDPVHCIFRLEEGETSSSAGWGAAQGGVGILQVPDAPVTTEKAEEEMRALPPTFRYYLYLPVVLRGGS